MQKKEGLDGASKLRDIILGGQDGLVNVLGLVLGVAGATASTRIILISGLAGTFAESLSMAAVAYTSSKAARDYYAKALGKKRTALLATTIAQRELISKEYSPLKDAFIVGIASVIGSLIPLISFFFLPVREGIITTLFLSVACLFATGAAKAKLTVGDWRKSGIEMALIGTGAAVVGYLIGLALGTIPFG